MKFNVEAKCSPLKYASLLATFYRLRQFNGKVPNLCIFKVHLKRVIYIFCFSGDENILIKKNNKDSSL